MNLFNMPPIEDGDVLGRIIILIIIYIVAIKSSKKKKNAGRAKRDQEPLKSAAAKANAKQKPSRQNARRERAPGQRTALERRPLATQMQLDLEAAGEGDDPCHEGDLRPARPGMRFSSVSQEGMSLAGEGEDPCHTGDAPRGEHNPVYDSPILSGGEDDLEAFGRQVLSGVIMSEVLKRPQQRRMERKLRGRV